MENKKLVLIGLLTAIMLSSTTVFADDNVKEYYKTFVNEEMAGMPTEEKMAMFHEILDKQVEDGKLSQKEADEKFSAFSENIGQNE